MNRSDNAMAMRRQPILVGLLVGMLASCGSKAPATPQIDQLGIRNLSTPLRDVACSGQPTEAQFDALLDAGVTRVIHLRRAVEKGTGWEEARAQQAGIDFIRLEIAGKEGLTKKNVERFASLMATDQQGTTLVSCGSSNRVGAILALKAFWLDLMPREEALALGRNAGMKSLASTVEQLTAK